MVPLPGNTFAVILHPDRIEFEPKYDFPRVTTTLEVAVNWNDNQDTWRSVTFRNFKVVDSRYPVARPRPPERTINEADNGYPEDFKFPVVTEECRCKFDVVFEGHDGKTLTVDPVIILKPAGSGGSIEPTP